MKEVRPGLVHLREDIPDRLVRLVVFAFGVERGAVGHRGPRLRILGEQAEFPSVQIERLRSDVFDQIVEGGDGEQCLFGDLPGPGEAGVDLLSLGIDAGLLQVEQRQLAASRDVRANFFLTRGRQRFDQLVEVVGRAAEDIAAAVLGKRRVFRGE